MNSTCSYHPSVIAVNKCENCNKPICIVCMRKYIGFARIQYTYCNECYDKAALKCCQCVII